MIYEDISDKVLIIGKRMVIYIYIFIYVAIILNSKANCFWTTQDKNTFSDLPTGLTILILYPQSKIMSYIALTQKVPLG